jgi:hypothetical protein
MLTLTSAPLQHPLSFARIAANKVSVYAAALKIIGFTVVPYFHILTRLLLQHHLPPPANTKFNTSMVSQLAPLHPISRQTLMRRRILILKRSLIDSECLGTRLLTAGGDVMAAMPHIDCTSRAWISGCGYSGLGTHMDIFVSHTCDLFLFFFFLVLVYSQT